jgi:hypothetical protein
MLLHGRSVATGVWRGKVDGAPCAVGLPGRRARGLAGGEHVCDGSANV